MNPKQPSAARRKLFEDLYNQVSREVWSIAYARWLNADVAQDIMQDAFLRLWRQWEQGQTIDNPRAWLVRVAHNLAEDHGKSAFRRNGTQTPQMMNGVTSRELPPADAVVRDEDQAKIRSCLAELPEGDREILTLRYALDYDTNRIAALLSVNSAAVHMRLSRARRKLGELLTARDLKSMP